ncbi:MAG: hypothetical protein MUP85_15040, partial [Candidatus Lokiarchaeota archaeon]|nr:hypothetical protein [Candidatus Lokiarchaeota archaeon]
LLVHIYGVTNKGVKTLDKILIIKDIKDNAPAITKFDPLLFTPYTTINTNPIKINCKMVFLITT